MMFIKFAAVQLQQLGLRQQLDFFNQDQSKDEKDNLKVSWWNYLSFKIFIFSNEDCENLF